jgi:YHS domain-containing protein
MHISIPSRQARCAAAIVLVSLFPLGTALAVDEHFMKDGAAAGGVDVVAYHTMGKPTPGSSQFTAAYQGATWQFASAANRDLFAATPARYAPAYGGWCAAGASKGKKVATKAEFWKIVDGQLYLNSSEGADKMLVSDPQGVIRKGEANWKTIYATEAGKL